MSRSAVAIGLLMLVSACPEPETPDGSGSTADGATVHDAHAPDVRDAGVAHDSAVAHDAATGDAAWSFTLNGELAFTPQRAFNAFGAHAPDGGFTLDLIQAIVVDRAATVAAACDAEPVSPYRAINVAVGVDDGGVAVGVHSIAGSPMASGGGAGVMYIQNPGDGGSGTMASSVSGTITLTEVGYARVRGSFDVVMTTAVDGGTTSALSGTFEVPGCIP